MTRRRRCLSLALALAVTGALASPGQASADDALPVKVTVNTGAALSVVPATAVGVNDAVWDSQLGTTAVSDLLETAGVGTRRYPGGSYADIYHWKDHTAPGGYVAPDTGFDTWMAGVKRTGAQSMIIANYGTGTAEEAADWVRYANVTKKYGAQYWTIGNENYGNGLYGSSWEADNHADKSATAYAKGVVAFAEAMKAVDPTVKIGAVLTMPGEWPDGITAGGDPGPWNRTVLGIAGSKIDFVDVHWYPGGSAAASLASTKRIPDAIALLRQQITRYVGANPGRIGISLTETNVGTGKNTQPAALFLADAASSLLEQGLFTIDWWDLHNGIGTPSTVAGHTDYDDLGMLSSAGCTSDNSVCEPTMNTPFAPYYGLQMMNTFARPGDRFVTAATDVTLVTAHAVRRDDGDLAVLLVNKDPDHAYTATLGYSGWTPATTSPTVYSFANGATKVTSAPAGTAAQQTLAPYSLTTLVLHPASAPSAGAPTAPGQPVLEQVTDRTATISWPASSGGSGVKYEIYRQYGAVSEQLGETTDSSFTVQNLNPGTRYTVNVIARDNAGRVSLPSSPLTFSTISPAKSSCTVAFTDASDWGNGDVTNVDITNNGPDPIDGWTLAFAWPTTAQQVGSGWNGTWTQTGTSVRVTSLDANRHLAAGATTSTGAVISYSGPNVMPTAFTLNGTVCHTA